MPFIFVIFILKYAKALGVIVKKHIPLNFGVLRTPNFLQSL